MDKELIEEINYWHVKGVDKWHRMFDGYSSDFIDLVNDTLYLEIHLTPSFKRNPIKIAKQVAGEWVDYRQQLAQAKRYHVTVINTDAESGFVISLETVKDTNKVQKLIDKLKTGGSGKKTSKERSVVEGIYKKKDKKG